MVTNLTMRTTRFHFVITNICAFQSYLVVGGANIGAFHFFMNRTHSVQIQSESLGGRSGSMITAIDDNNLIAQNF